MDSTWDSSFILKLPFWAYLYDRIIDQGLMMRMMDLLKDLQPIFYSIFWRPDIFWRHNILWGPNIKEIIPHIPG